MQYPIEIDYTIPTLHNILEIIADDIEKRVILDIKIQYRGRFYRILDEVELLASKFRVFEYDKIRNQVLIETFDEESFFYGLLKNWESLLTDYRNGDDRWLQ